MLKMMVFLVIAMSVQAKEAPDKAALTRLLNEFLAGASVNDAKIHDRFWADDLIYTGSSGRRIGKADIMKDLSAAPQPKPDDPKTVYSAEDVRIQQYGNTAIVAFRLVGTMLEAGKTVVAKYLNSGTFLKRNGKWQVVNWQATRMPRAEDDAKKDIQSLLKDLSPALDENFVWTRGADQVTRQKFLAEKPAIDLTNATVSIFGDTAIARTATTTVVFVNRDGAWRAVAMQTP